MGSQIKRDRVLGNFKAAKDEKPKNSQNYLRRTGMSRAHLARVRQLSCCVCGVNAPSTVHHAKATGERGIGLRSTDQHVVPMCWPCHDEVERAGSKNEISWFRSRGVNALALARALYGATSRGRNAMQAIVDAHYEQ
jgi:hypothetical protein